MPPLRVGGTPLFDAPRLAADLGLAEAWVKDDGQNPTGSLKDRASALVVARAAEAGIEIVSTASTGNAAAALAGIAASIGMKTIIFVPAAAPEAKIAQLLVYGATVLMVEASYDVAFDLCYDLCLSEGWYCRNTGMNPYTVEGKKTVAYEIAEELGWDVPDVVIGERGGWQHHRRGVQGLPRPAGTRLDRADSAPDRCTSGRQFAAGKRMADRDCRAGDARDCGAHDRRQHLGGAAA